MMADQAAVDLDELLVALNVSLDDWQSFLDLQTGRVISVPTECFRQLEASALDARHIDKDRSAHKTSTT